MATGLTPFASTKETTNYARLCRLLVDVGCQVLRSTFDNMHPPATLRTVLGITSVHYATLQSLYKKKVLNATQWLELYPTHSPVSSATFDITLLTVLLRNICGLSPPATGWDRLPPAANISIADDIARVKYYRNTVCGHASQASVDDINFITYWQEIREALVRLGGAHFRADVDNLEHECMDPVIVEHYRELMKQWKKDDDNIKDRLEEIEESLEKMRQKIEIEIKEIKETLSSSRTTAEKSRDEGIFDPSEHINGIRQLYKTRAGWLSPFPWCEEFQFSLGNIFTRLKVVRRNKTGGEVTDKFVDMSSILDPYEECSAPRTVLIEGEPGMGKTTYCKKCVYDWATKEEKSQGCGVTAFKAVLLLDCRDIHSDVWEAIEDQLLPRDIEEKVKQQFFQFIRENQSSILLILDGLDEVQDSKLPMLTDWIVGRILPGCHIIATARHEAGKAVRKWCDALLEIVGFTEEHVGDYVIKYFKDKRNLATKLLERIKRDKNLKEMSANPLNTALLCLICEEFDGTLPNNRAQLYLDIVECILKRYREKEEQSETNVDLTNLYRPQLNRLGLVALTGLLNDKLDFDESELGNPSNDLIKFGFLSVQSGSSKLKPKSHYAFLHKSFQECFAAFSICSQIQRKEITPEKLVSDDRYFSKLKQVLLFSCRILSMQCEEQVVALVNSLTSQVNKDGGTNTKVVLEAIYECKRNKDDLHLRLARCFGSGLNLTSLNLCTTSNDNAIGDAGVISIAESIKVNKTLTDLDLSRNDVGDVGATYIAGAIKVNKTLTTLTLSWNGINETGVISIAKAVEFNNTLTTLDLSRNRLTDATSIAEAIKVNKTLTNLNLSRDHITDVGAKSIAEAIKINENLRNLDVSSNLITKAGALSLAKAIRVNKTMTNLNWNDCGFGDEGATSIAKAINDNETLTNLYLNANMISDGGAISLAEAMKVNKTLTNLDLSYNTISDAGATSIAEAIKVNKTLTYLNLSENQIGDGGATFLAEAIKVNKTLTNLNLSHNDFGDVGATYVAEAIKGNTILTNLNLSGNSLSVAVATSIAETIKVNKAVTNLNLGHDNLIFSG